MNILFIAHRIPYPPDKGDKIRSFHQIKYLSKKHKIFLVAFVDDEQELQYRKQLEEHCATVRLVHLNNISALSRSVVAVPGNIPLSIAYYRHGEIYKYIADIIKNVSIDVCLAFSSQMAQYIPWHSPCRKIMDFIDVDSDKWEQYSKFKPFPLSTIYKVEARRLRLYESMISKAVDLSIFVTSQELELFKSLNKDINDVKCATVMNGIDTDYFCPGGGGSDVTTTSDNNAPRLVFVGALDYFPNVDGILYFAKDILPIIRRQFPEIVLEIVGRNPDPSILKIAKNFKCINVTGTVPDVRPYLMRATVAIAPLRMARGVQNKVLEAMAMMLPTVVSRKAYEGLSAKDGEHLIVADGISEFSEGVVHLLKNSEYRKAIGMKARNFVESNYSWDSSMSNLEKLLEMEECGESKHK